MGGGYESKPGGRSRVDGTSSGAAPTLDCPGKRTLTQDLAPVQQRADGDAGARQGTDVHAAAKIGLQGSPQALPHLDQIQRSFGPHDATGIRAFVGGPAAEAASAMGARAYATGDATAFAAAPDLHTAAHEAAHVVQQRAGVHLAGGVGREGDAYEQHADAVADLVVQGKSAAAELDRFAPRGASGPSSGGHAAATQRQVVQLDKDPKAGASKDAAAAYPKVVAFGTENVRVHSAAEEKEAQDIISFIKTEYAITLSSKAGVDAIKKDYAQVPKAVVDGLKTKQWEIQELRALKKALAHFAAVLGKNRETSSRKDVPQEITTGSKVDHGIDEDSPTGVLDDTTMGEFFESSKNFSMFSAGTDFKGEASVGVFKDNETNLEANATHEMAHGIFQYAEPAFIKEIGYWTDGSTKSGTKGAEEPVTPYGQTSASEDMAESVKFYFLDRATLLKNCPKRHAFVKKTVDAWTAKPAPAGAGKDAKK